MSEPEKIAVLVIEPAAADDLALIAGLNVSAYAEFEARLGEAVWVAMRRNLTAVSEVAGRAEFWIARDEGRLVGSVAYGPAGRNDPALFPPDWAAVLLLAVDPAARGQGIGRRLTEVCVARAREDGAAAIGLFTSEAMSAARSLYQTLGFTCHAELPRRHGLRYWLYKRDLAGDRPAS